MPGVSSDDEMFILLGSRLHNYDTRLKIERPAGPEVTIVQPLAGESFEAGDTIPLQLAFRYFELLPPEDHAGMDHIDAHDTSHQQAGEDHSTTSSGHYHVYLDSRDDSADHITAWSEDVDVQLPEELAPGPHTIRVSLRAPDHHAVGVETSIIIEVN
jgi:hypothetical protein